jgi:hypothetical protein
MEQPSKRAQFVPGMRAYSAHNRLHVNAPTLCRFAQSYIIGGNTWKNHPGDEPRRFLRERIWPSARAAKTPLGGRGLRCPRANAAAFSQRDARAVTGAWPNFETGVGEEAGTQFVPGMRAYSAHNRLHVNAPPRC